jgi:signal transduction histidine kinase
MEPRLAHAGVTLDWKVAPAAKSPDLSSAQVLHVLRIVQEAVTNALKHARPSRLQICFQDDGARWTLSIVDDGTGFAPSKSHSGNGLNNMRTRSLQAGLALAVDSSSNGTSIRLGSE